MIIEGEITDSHSFEDDKRIYTLYTLEVENIFKGSISTNQVKIVRLGGTLPDGRGLKSAHAEQLYKGEKGVFYLSNTSGHYDELNFDIGEAYILSANKWTIHYTTYPRSTKDGKNSYIAYDFNRQFASRREIYELFGYNNSNKTKKSSTAKKTGSLFLDINNQVLNYPIYNFNIGVSTDLNDVFLFSSEIFISYDPNSLGENIIQNGVISVEAINGLRDGYSITMTDHNANTFRIAISNNGLSDLLPLSATRENILSVGINISELDSNTPINMDRFLMDERSFYYSPSIGRPLPFTNIIVPGEETFLSTGCISFFPEELNAGVGDILTIEPDSTFNFGFKKGFVFLSNAEDPNNFTLVDSFYIDWTPSQINVIVPHLTQQKGLPGSGAVKVEYFDLMGNIISITSKEVLHICYNITNDLCIGSSLDVIEDVRNSNNEGGYTFYLGSRLDTLAGGEARKRIKEAICLWGDQTGINFTLSDSTILNPDPITGQKLMTKFDSLNVIFLGDSTSGFADKKIPTAQVMSYGFSITNIDPILSCFEERALFDIDIIVNDTVGFNFTLNYTETTQVDFYSTIIHELGNAHSHHHANHPWQLTNDNQTKTMFWVLESGQEKRYVDKECAEKGSNFILNHSQELTLLTPPMSSGGCTTNSTTQKENSFLVEINPNPTTSWIDVSFLIEQQKTFHISIYNIAGNVVYSIPNLISSQGINEIRINEISSLPNGVYFIQLQGKNISKTVKLVKQ